jgi:hypothetical protein
MALKARRFHCIMGFCMEAAMAAFIWNANPGRWEIVPPATDGWTALMSYVCDPSRYVYWSTPMRQKDIQIGDQAYIWRTKFLDRLSGIIAVGVVAEKPRQLTNANFSNFERPDRLKAAGWNEANAPSVWKTGIEIQQTYWETPVAVGLTISQGTVRGLRGAEVEQIVGALQR